MNSCIRAFAAIDIDEAAKAYINDALRPLRTLGLHAGWTKPENFHITLKFFGNVRQDTLTQIQDGMSLASKSHTAFGFNLKGIGQFPEKGKPKTLWLGIEKGNEQFALLARTISQHCPCPEDESDRTYHAHLTVARLKSPPRNTRELEETIKALEITVPEQRATHLKLVKSTLTSHGPVYEVINEFPLS